ncbi:alpha-D-ribose 1-methylphosphonate 5-triphosphate diphosphatase [Hoeflea prorocentri]|uniref:Alpha-D-ribose 1-methylphosphonate 5-triphosphate diphosphatase n=1 Tax=Hoeflea prorocentri TaxID=1922333 RepID=A0A9X3UJF9_9HYPH|nr:alpha-D-ribose 1-methylphosphonate 5-triphosphate diphosphatase [Hoeflea prorocentri]MCY6381545.1 alpha-D-ribose 1-methylphosphonate 5-triphosphate diphosphatase [Hoeflea prorocentri]MDA5399345.1 alpha-D-ribose 1-methylphosphonate 5-triphosphate diphosphatase [Hoeflea prorocentri]
MISSVSLIGGTVLTSHGALEAADVHIADGMIVEAPSPSATAIDCRSFCVLPGIVDVHGDAFEVALHPRPGVNIAFPIAMRWVDRQLLANGITTVFHGLTLSWEPGARSLPAGRDFMDGLEGLRPQFLADHRVQLRWETFAHDAIDDIDHWLARHPKPALAFNDHTTLTLEAARSGNTKKLEVWAHRAGLTLKEYLAMAEEIGRRAPDVADKVRDVAERASRRGAIMLSHDEKTRGEREQFRNLGAKVCEFPLARKVAEDAVSNGEYVIMGAPNVIRGGSHTGAMSAEDAIGNGLCDVLASDYYYPSLLHAAEHLVARGVCSFGEAWNLVSRNPAASMGLQDRGAIETGRRADLAVLDCTGPWRLVHLVVGGVVTTFGS